MAIKINLIIVLGISTVMIFTSCGKNGVGCANTTYNFQIGVRAYPDRDSIKVGDTIWIKSNIYTFLNDQKSNQKIDYSNAANLSVSVQLLKLTGGSINDPGASYSANKFVYFSTIGTQINDAFTEGQRSFSFLEQKGLYNLLIAIIPKERGIFIMAVSNAVNVYRNNDKCTKANYEINVENTNQHLFLYQNNRPGYMISAYEKTHSYCFKVY